MKKIIIGLFLPALLVLSACQASHDTYQEKQQAAEMHGKAARLNTQLGLSYLKQGDRPRAKRKLFTALKLEPDSPEVLTALAYYYEKTEENEKAGSYYLKAMQLSTSKGPQYNNYGAFLCRQGNYKASIQYFLKAAQDPQYINTAAAYENAGLCAEEIPDYTSATGYFTKALEQDPERVGSFYELVKMNKKQGNLAKLKTLSNQYPHLAASPAVAALLGNTQNLASNQAVNTGVQNEHNG